MIHAPGSLARPWAVGSARGKEDAALNERARSNDSGTPTGSLDPCKGPLASRVGRFARRASLCAVLMAPVLGTTLAHAAPETPAQTSGRVLFDEGMTLFNAGRLAEACPKFEASFRQYPGIGTRGKLAECYEKLGRLATAYRTYRETYQLAMKSGDAVRAQIASERAAALEPRLGRYVIVVPGGSDLPNLTVSRGHIPIERSTWSTPQFVDAGTILFEFSAPNHVTQLRRVTITDGQAIEVRVPKLALANGDATATPTEEPEDKAQETSFTPPPYEPERPSEWQKPTGLIVAGVGVAGLAASGIFGILAKTKYDDAFDGGGCEVSSRRCTAEGQRSVDDARGAATTSTVFAIAGGALAATGLVLYLTAPSTRSTGLRVVPTSYGVAGGGVTFAGSL